MAKMAKSEKYQEICHELGFIPEVHFVKITNRGTISFTVGKPDEVRALWRAVMKAGYKPAAALAKAAREG